ncbi:hypothetical protein, partial [Stenotrophomonas sp. PS02298]|uniref:hypothetical protein n=1 Tax=Stenotrophomonas sp. PS02298 TaxID=2991424 RepID=UPI002499D687
RAMLGRGSTGNAPAEHGSALQVKRKKKAATLPLRPGNHRRLILPPSIVLAMAFHSPDAL